MKVQLVEIADINPAAYNPREITPYAFSGLCESIRKFGLQQPLIVNKKTNTLVSGHQRLKVAEHIGLKKVPVVYVDLTPAEEKAFNITLNNKAIEGDFTEGLRDLLAEIKEEFDEDFIFDLNLDETLKGLPSLSDLSNDDEGEEGEDDESLKPTSIKITFHTLDNYPIVFEEVKQIVAKYEGIEIK